MRAEHLESKQTDEPPATHAPELRSQGKEKFIPHLCFSSSEQERKSTQDVLQDTFDAAERALQGLVDLGLSTCEERTELLALGPALSAAVDKLEAHYEAVEQSKHRKAGRMSQDLAGFWSSQVRNLDYLMTQLRCASDRKSAAQAVLLVAVVMLGDWHAHGSRLASMRNRRFRVT